MSWERTADFCSVVEVLMFDDCGFYVLRPLPKHILTIFFSSFLTLNSVIFTCINRKTIKMKCHYLNSHNHNQIIANFNVIFYSIFNVLRIECNVAQFTFCRIYSCSQVFFNLTILYTSYTKTMCY